MTTGGRAPNNATRGWSVTTSRRPGRVGRRTTPQLAPGYPARQASSLPKSVPPLSPPGRSRSGRESTTRWCNTTSAPRPRWSCRPRWRASTTRWTSRYRHCDRPGRSARTTPRCCAGSAYSTSTTSACGVVATALEEGRRWPGEALRARAEVDRQILVGLAGALTAVFDGVVLHRLVDVGIDVTPWADALEAVLAPPRETRRSGRSR